MSDRPTIIVMTPVGSGAAKGPAFLTLICFLFFLAVPACDSSKKDSIESPSGAASNTVEVVPEVDRGMMPLARQMIEEIGAEPDPLSHTEVLKNRLGIYRYRSGPGEAFDKKLELLEGQEFLLTVMMRGGNNRPDPETREVFKGTWFVENNMIFLVAPDQSEEGAPLVISTLLLFMDGGLYALELPPAFGSGLLELTSLKDFLME